MRGETDEEIRGEDQTAGVSTPTFNKDGEWNKISILPTYH